MSRLPLYDIQNKQPKITKTYKTTLRAQVDSPRMDVFNQHTIHRQGSDDLYCKVCTDNQRKPPIANLGTLNVLDPNQERNIRKDDFLFRKNDELHQTFFSEQSIPRRNLNKHSRGMHRNINKHEGHVDEYESIYSDLEHKDIELDQSESISNKKSGIKREARSIYKSALKRKSFSSIICPFDKDETEETYVKFPDESDLLNCKLNKRKHEKHVNEQLKDSECHQKEISARDDPRSSHESMINQKQFISPLILPFDLYSKEVENTQMKHSKVQEKCNSSSNGETSSSGLFIDISRRPFTPVTQKQAQECAVDSGINNSRREFLDSDEIWYSATAIMPPRKTNIKPKVPIKAKTKNQRLSDPPVKEEIKTLKEVHGENRFQNVYSYLLELHHVSKRNFWLLLALLLLTSGCLAGCIVHSCSEVPQVKKSHFHSLVDLFS